MLPAAPASVSHPCACVCVCSPCTRWSSISWPRSVVSSLWEGWAPEWRNMIRTEGFSWNDHRPGLSWPSTCLVVLSTLLYAGQAHHRFTVVQSLVKDGVGVTLNLFFLLLWGFVVFLYLFSFNVFQGLGDEQQQKKTIHIILDTIWILLLISSRAPYLC